MVVLGEYDDDDRVCNDKIKRKADPAQERRRMRGRLRLSECHADRSQCQLIAQSGIDPG